MKRYFSKRIYWNKKYFVQVRIYADLETMRTFYKKTCPMGDYKVLGVSINRESYKITKSKMAKFKNNKFTNKDWNKLKRSNQTGIVLLSKQYCGATIATHELMHATIFAYQRFIKDKNQYPFIIKNMDEEEKLLKLFSKIVFEFYRWYWKIENKLDKLV